MKKLALTLFNTFLLTIAFAQFKPQGTYVGVEKIKGYSSSEKPKYVWYHLSVLTIKGDSVFLEQSPVAIYKNDTIFSASDGGFYSYVGTIENYEGKTFADLELKSCDYCPKQFIKFTPPIIKKDEDTAQNRSSGTETTPDKPQTVEISTKKFKIMILEKSKNNNALLVDKNVYRRKKGK